MSFAAVIILGSLFAAAVPIGIISGFWFGFESCALGLVLGLVAAMFVGATATADAEPGPETGIGN